MLSCSWSWGNPGDYNIIAQGADWLVEDGIVVVAAAANSGPNPGTVFSPATGRYVIGVGAASDPSVGGSWSLCDFSSRGPCLDGRIKPDILAPGKNIMAARFLTTDQYREMTGTSMATPFVAGLVALWLDYDVTLGNHGITDFNPKIKYVLMGSATDVPGDSSPGKDNNYGAGRVDMQDNWMFVHDDISRGFSDAPLVLGYSWYEQSYTRQNEGLWPYDDAGPNYGDYYKLNAYSGIFVYAEAHGDPDLQLKIRIYDRYYNLLVESFVGRDKNVGWWAAYSGVYYVRISAENLSADWYRVSILTTPS